DHFTVEVQVDPFLAEEIGDRLRDVLVLPRDQARPELDQGHLAAEAAIHLGEFESDVAAAQDDEMWRKKIDVHHRAVGEIRDLIEAGNRGDYRACADIDKDAIGSELCTIHCYFLFRGKAGVARVYRATFQRP